MKTITPYYQTSNALLYHGDCLDILPQIDTSSVHMVLCDLPYGTTYCPWDALIPLVPLWRHLERVIIGTGAMVFTASQPFTTQLIQSNIDRFKYEWIWNKEHAANFANANHQPLKQHENVLVFSTGVTPYYPMKTKSEPYKANRKPSPSEYRNINCISGTYKGVRFPKTILDFPRSPQQCKFHTTEKPVELMEYLIRTYTQEGETVLDATCGSGTTLVAALQSKRRCVGIELDKEYCEVTRRRILRFEPFKITKSV